MNRQYTASLAVRAMKGGSLANITIPQAQLYSPINELVRQDLSVASFFYLENFDGRRLWLSLNPPDTVVIDCLSQPWVVNVSNRQQVVQ
jgi:hypothetical protein